MPDPVTTFSQLELPGPLLRAIEDVGYEEPTPIQAATIGPLLEGRDLLGQAQTGTGKTAAFALPLLARIRTGQRRPQLLVLTPTRELAIQVSEAFQRYAHYLQDFHVLPVYGGQSYQNQLRQLKRGVQVVVGTPGRVMDHMRNGKLGLEQLQSLVLDEADEMLRMGFIEDVEWVLQHTPPGRQIALFSATMPAQVKKVAKRHLHDPVHIHIERRTMTAETIRQRYWPVSGLHKLDALTRLLELETFDAMLVFVRTRTASVELAEKLEARGHACEALNGDIPQAQRERTVDRLRKGQLDILVATDVVARGLDVERISHVVNYDIPYDVEAYIHRIGRTGRAGRKGEAILFVSGREQRLLRAIEKTIGRPIEAMRMPTARDINQQRVLKFKQRITETLASGHQDLFYQLLTEVQQETSAEPMEIAAALATLMQGAEPLLLPEREEKHREARPAEKPARKGNADQSQRSSTKALPLKGHPEVEMQRFRLNVGYRHGVKPGNIVGAVANEAELDAQYIGHIEIFEEFTTIDLPSGMPPETYQALKKTRVCRQRLDIRLLESPPGKNKRKHKKTGKRKSRPKKGKRF